MSNRLKEQGFLNSAQIKHDNVGNYIDQNGVREYSLTYALVHNTTSTTVSGHTAPLGSLARTTHATGKGGLFIAGATTWQAIASAVSASPLGYLRYEATIVQATTAAPTVQTEHQNELSGAIVLTRTGVGAYVGTLAGAFLANKATVKVHPNHSSTALVGKGGRLTDNTIAIDFFDAAGAAVDLAGTANVEVHVFP